MPLNLLKIYPQLLEIDYMSVRERTLSLMGIFKRDIEDNNSLNFRTKKIRPIKGEEPDMQNLFNHLTRVEVIDEKGQKTKERIYESERSKRLHWIRYHIEENKTEKVEIFSIEERVSGADKIRTYIYDVEQKYVIVLEPQRSGLDYYLLTAYYLDRAYGEKQIQKKLKKRLPNIH